MELRERWRALPLAARGFVLATLAGLVLYLPLLSIQWDANGIIEARAIERGAVVSANHLLYRPLMSLALQGAHTFGYAPPFASLYQILTAIISALGVGAFFVAVFFLTRHVWASALAAIFYATTWAYWTFSTDIYYITFAAAFASATLALLARPVRSRRGVLLASIFCAASVLAWQANIFLLPAFALVYYARARKAKNALLFLVSASALIAAAYLYVGTQWLHLNNFDALRGWLLSHSSDQQGRLAQWGQWSVTRVRPMLVSAVASFVPIWEGLGLRALLRGSITLESLLRQLSLVALGVIAALTILRAWQKRAVWRDAVVVALGFFALLPFIVWWDPSEPKWFVVANLFLIAAAAMLWGFSFTPRDFWIVGACIVIIAFANFTATILPRHTQPNPNLALAACVTRAVESKDAVVLTDWNWFDYANYFERYAGETLQLVGGGERAQKIARVQQAVIEASARGGKVYLRDFDTMSAADRGLTQFLTGLDRDAFAPFSPQPAFACQGQQFLQIR